MIQVKLESGESHLTCWVDKTVKEGDMITLKDWVDPTREWAVVRVYETTTPPQRGWKVGGLT
jgi:hypothetical protein